MSTKATLPARLWASASAARLRSRQRRWAASSVTGRPSRTTNPPARLTMSIMPPTRRRYSATHFGPPNPSSETPSAARSRVVVVVAPETEDDRVDPPLLDLLGDVAEPVEDVRAGETGGDAAVDVPNRLHGVVASQGSVDRIPRRDDERVAGDPEAHLVPGGERDLLGLRGRCRRRRPLARSAARRSPSLLPGSSRRAKAAAGRFRCRWSRVRGRWRSRPTPAAGRGGEPCSPRGAGPRTRGRPRAESPQAGCRQTCRCSGRSGERRGRARAPSPRARARRWRTAVPPRSASPAARGARPHLPCRSRRPSELK